MFLRNIVSFAFVFALYRVGWPSFCMISRRVALLVRVAFSVRDIALYRVVWPRCCVISRRLALLLGNIALCGLFLASDRVVWPCLCVISRHLAFFLPVGHRTASPHARVPCILASYPRGGGPGSKPLRLLVSQLLMHGPKKLHKSE